MSTSNQVSKLLAKKLPGEGRIFLRISSPILLDIVPYGGLRQERDKDRKGVGEDFQGFPSKQL